MNTTNSTNTTTLNYAGTVLDRVCPGNSFDDIHNATQNHLDPFQLLILASAVVAFLSIFPFVQQLLVWNCDTNGDGTFDGKDVTNWLNRCCGCCGCCKKKTDKGDTKERSSQGASAVAIMPAAEAKVEGANDPQQQLHAMTGGAGGHLPGTPAVQASNHPPRSQKTTEL